MAYNAFSQAVFSMNAPCLPCCETACFLTLPPLDGDPPYADEATAQAALDNQTMGCVVYSNIDTTSFVVVSRTWTATVALNILTTSDSIVFSTAPGWSYSDTAKVFLTAADGISGTYSFTASGAVDKTNPLTYGTLVLSDEGGTAIDSTGPLSLDASGSYSFTVPSDGRYFIGFLVSAMSDGSPGDASLSAGFTADVGDDGEVCVIRAAYDDGGSTAYLICV